MERIFQEYWPVKDFYRFEISNNENLTHFDYNLNGLSFQYIQFQNLSNMTTITPDFFSASAETLEEMRIKKSNLEDFPIGNITEFTNLSLLYIMVSQLKTIPHLISNSLEQLSMSDAQITDMPAGENYILFTTYRLQCFHM